MLALPKFLSSSRRRGSHSPDFVIILALTAIVVFGLLMLTSASSNLSIQKYDGDAFFFLKNQLTRGFAVGAIFFFITYFINFRLLKKLALPLFVISLILLILVFTPLGVTEKGASRWLDIGILTIQPSEIIKFTFILYLASWLSGREGAHRRKTITAGLIPFLVISGVVSGLLLKQPATSIVGIIMLAALIVYFSSGARMSFITGMILFGLLVVTAFIITTPYRLERITTFLDSMNGQGIETQGSGYHLNQALITIGSGGLTGVGYGNSINKTKYLPEPIGDSIFAVIAEEFGFIGGSILILLFLIIIIRGLIIAKRLDNDFARLVVIGFTSIIGIQTFIHIGSISGIIPMTGVPLPFISYGSTALVVFLSMAGIILNLSKDAK